MSEENVWIKCPNSACDVVKHRDRICGVCGEPPETECEDK
jgi:hypothetical protein